MEDEPLCFYPDLGDLNAYIWILSAGAIMAITILLYSVRTSKLIPKYKHLFQLASAMGFVICTGLLIFSIWSKSRLQEVCLDDTNIKIGKKFHSYSSVKNVQIYADQQGEKMVQIRRPDQYQLLIIDLEKQQLVFSEHHPVMDMYRELQLKLKKDD
jgi:hypothetical protein